MAADPCGQDGHASTTDTARHPNATIRHAPNFFDTKYGASAIERDYERMKEVERQVEAMLDRLPPEPPMTPEHMEKVGAVVSAALRKRFGEGTAEELDEAVQAAWPSRWVCSECGWPWPLKGPPVVAECDNCGGELEEEH